MIDRLQVDNLVAAVELWAASAVHQVHGRSISGMRGFMDARTRLGGVRLYEQLGDAGLVCRRCGISRPTLRKWWHRYQADGVAGLKGESRRPHHLAKRKIFAEQEALVLDLRRSRRLGIKQLRSELLRQHGLGLSLETLHRILSSATASSI